MNLLVFPTAAQHPKYIMGPTYGLVPLIKENSGDMFVLHFGGPKLCKLCGHVLDDRAESPRDLAFNPEILVMPSL